MSNYTRLSMRERCNLALFLEMNLNMSEIAQRMGRHRSTLYRELSRNPIDQRYKPGVAHHKAQARHPRKRCKLQSNPELYQYVYDKLKQGWSPEQISGRMKLDKTPFSVCHETIYQYIYQKAHTELYPCLTRKKRKKRKLRARIQGKCRFGDIRLITKRPGNIEKRNQIGHWEGDLIEFSGKKKTTVTTLVERKSRFLSLIKNTTKVSTEVMSGIQHKFAKQFLLTCKTMTFDQGGEFADYRQVECALGCKVYYCEKRSPWQKGSNENMNGRLRRYLPKTANIEKITQKSLDHLAEKMNTIPRKCLGFNTPKEVFLRHFKPICRTET